MIEDLSSAQSIESFLAFESSAPKPGKFSMKYQAPAVTFQWIPDDSTPFDQSTLNVEQAHIFFFLHKIKKVSKLSSDGGEVIVRFFVQDNRLFSKFIFPIKSQPAVETIFSFLLSHMFIETSGRDPASYNVLLSTNKNFRLPADMIDLVQAQCVYSHRVVISKLFSDIVHENTTPITLDEAKQYFTADGRINNFAELKALIFRRGLDDSSRYLILPHLLQIFLPQNTKEENEFQLSKLNAEFLSIISQWELCLPSQKRYSAPFYSVILSDVARTDRTKEMFRDEDAPALRFLEDVLVCFAISQPDVGYTQGMGDLAAALMQIIFKKVNPDKSAIMADGSNKPAKEAESLIFWMLCGLLSVTRHEVFFANMQTNRDFFANRVFAIIEKFHPTAARWLMKSDIGTLLFTLSAFLLLFKRTFSMGVLLPLWDRILSAQDPQSFLRFLLAATVIETFPALILKTGGQAGEVAQFYDESLPQCDLSRLLDLTNAMIERVKKDDMHTQWLFMNYPVGPQKEEYIPNLLNLKC